MDKHAGDVLPPETSKWQYVEERARGLLEAHAFREVRVPLRPPETALADVYVARTQWSVEPVTRWYRLGPGAGLHHLAGAVFGVSSPALDAEIVAMLAAILTELGIPQKRLRISLAAGQDDELQQLLSGLALESTADAAPGLAFAIGSANMDGALCAGARDEFSIAARGGPSIPALTFGLDLPRVLEAVEEEADSFHVPVALFLAPADAAARRWALPFAHRLRLSGVRVELEHRPLSAEEALTAAQHSGARLFLRVDAALLGAGSLRLVDLATNREQAVAEKDLVGRIQQLLD